MFLSVVSGDTDDKRQRRPWCGIWYDLICLVWHVSCINKSHDDDYVHAFGCSQTMYRGGNGGGSGGGFARPCRFTSFPSLSLHNIKYNLFTSRLLHRVPVLCLLLMGKGQKPHLHRITIIIIIPTRSKVLLLTWYTVCLQFSFYTMLANIHIIFSSSSKKWSICPFYLSLFAHTH